MNPEKTWYVYDSAGLRIRKVTARAAADGTTQTKRKERIYLGMYEVYREYKADGTTVPLWRETIHVTGGASHLASIETRIKGTEPPPFQQILYYLSNDLNFATLELDENGSVISYE
ncbi:hypothetical protein B0O99DRAFT_694120 [Bisporella sp. PMI_857]|nr:hypothetical protein B0O99DRAFT_694120 [Bisporella sp. PMI_857]